MQLPKKFYYKKNRLQQLKGFYYTVQQGSISKAAIQMDLNQSTVTLQIQSLERDLGVQLLDRTRKKIVPNKDGRIFYDMVAYYLNGIDSLYEEFLNKKGDQTNVINIAAHHTAISYILPSYVAKFQSKYQNILINIKNITADEAIKSLQDNEVDLILYPNINLPAGFFSQVLFAYNSVLIMNKNHPLSIKEDVELKDISQYNTIAVDKKLLTLPIFEKIFEELKFKTNVIFESGNLDMVKNFVKAGVGLGFVPELCLEEQEGDLIYKRIDKYLPNLEYRLVVKNGRKPSVAVEDFIKVLAS